MFNSYRQFSGPTAISRREAICIGGSAALGLSAFQLAQAKSSPSNESRPSFGRAKACIVLWMTGGPPQHETWDPKPEAPAEIRGPFDSIATSLPGIRVGELMPNTARILDQLAVLRAVHTDNPSHPGSSYEMFTGVVPPLGKGRDDVVDSRSDFPTYSSIIKLLKPGPPGIPAAVVIPEPIFNVPFYPGQHGGFLGSRVDPWRLKCDPSLADFRVPELELQQHVTDGRLAARIGLVNRFDGPVISNRADKTLATYLTDSREALDLLGGRLAREALDLNREPAEVRDRYGRHKFGQGCLLARRLVEAGVPLVQVNWHRDDGDDTPMWDAHWKLEDNLKRKLMPPMDQSYPVLLADLKERGLLDDTLVIWMGEFGRTPKLEFVAPHPTIGRNHWGNVFSIALAGGGIRGGRVFGASDKDGAYPQEFPVEPGDLLATLYHALGIDPQTEIRDQLNRPHPISRGRVLHEVFA